MKVIGTAAALCLGASALTGCGGADDSGGGEGRGSGDVVDGGTFTMALATDPGNLDPQMGASSGLTQVSLFAYDSLVNINPADGSITSGIAHRWELSDKEVTLSLNEGVTCADGSEFTATDAADNLNYVADPKNQSPFLGVYFPEGATAEADDAAGTVTINLTAPAPFVLSGLASLSMVCGEAVADRGLLKDKTSGTGPYELTEAVPGDHYTYQIRDGYTWGPDGASTDTEGMPDTVVVRIVADETTAANLLLSGEVNSSAITGPEVQRLDNAGLFAEEVTGLVGEQWYNHADGHPTSDPAVRMALTQGVDLEQLQKVLTSNRGGPPTTLSTVAPAACPGDSVSGALPAFDVDAANKLLDDAGWAKGSDGIRTKDGTPLALKFVYDTSAGQGADGAAELATQAWEELGADVTAAAQTGGAIEQTLFATGDWDVAWIPLNVSSPDQIVPFLSGPVPPDGTNFSGIQNNTYDATVADASELAGHEGCSRWLEAESALIAEADIVPFANNVIKFYGSKAEFTVSGSLLPTSIKMLAS
jgi:peptide/nickel transport system substrate-binding protein